MDASSFYNRVIYRDFLGYVLPGSILVSSVLAAFSPIEIRGRIINPLEPFSVTQLLTLLGVGFIFGHLVGVIPRILLRKEKRWKALSKRAFENYRVRVLEPMLKEAFESVFGSDSWTTSDIIQRKELIYRFVSANNLMDDLDMLHRMESQRIFFENSTIILTLSMFVLATNTNIMSLSRTISALILCSLGIAVALLSLSGLRSIEDLQDRERIFCFVEHYMKTKNSHTTKVH